MTNKTINRVPRDLLERLDFGKDTKCALAALPELRALLAAPDPIVEAHQHEWDINEHGTATVCSICGVRSGDPIVEADEIGGSGYVLAKQTAVEVPGQERKELGYTIFDGIGVFHSREEVHATIAELGLPIGWVSMTVDQLLPGYMLPADAPDQVAALRSTISQLISCAEELADLVESGEALDSFTTQPVRNALAALGHDRNVEREETFGPDYTGEPAAPAKLPDDLLRRVLYALYQVDKQDHLVDYDAVILAREDVTACLDEVRRMTDLPNSSK